MHCGASLQGIKVNNTAYCGSVRCGRASRRPRRTVSVRSKDWERTGPEYVSGLSGLAQLAVGCARSGQEAYLNTHTCFYTGDISSDYHMATEARRRQRRNPAAAVTVLVLSARLAVRAISVAGTWSEQCAWIAVPSPHSALLVSVLSIFPFTTRLVAVNFPTVCSRQQAKPPPTPPPPPLPHSLHNPHLHTRTLPQNKTNMRGTHPDGTRGVVSSGVAFYF